MNNDLNVGLTVMASVLNRSWGDSASVRTLTLRQHLRYSAKSPVIVNDLPYFWGRNSPYSGYQTA